MHLCAKRNIGTRSDEDRSFRRSVTGDGLQRTSQLSSTLSPKVTFYNNSSSITKCFSFPGYSHVPCYRLDLIISRIQLNNHAGFTLKPTQKTNISIAFLRAHFVRNLIIFFAEVLKKYRLYKKMMAFLWLIKHLIFYDKYDNSRSSEYFKIFLGVDYN